MIDLIAIPLLCPDLTKKLSDRTAFSMPACNLSGYYITGRNFAAYYRNVNFGIAILQLVTSICLYQAENERLTCNYAIYYTDAKEKIMEYLQFYKLLRKRQFRWRNKLQNCKRDFQDSGITCKIATCL